MTLFYKDIQTCVGTLRLVANDKALIAILWESDKNGRVKQQSSMQKGVLSIFDKTELQLTEYFSGDRLHFDVPMQPFGTNFQQSVWSALQTISYATTVSYTEVAEQVACPGAVRAVASAIGRNPLSIVIPCHRVIGKKGHLTGFAGGLDVKAKLLKLEKRYCC